jgi:hypothetical protein
MRVVYLLCGAAVCMPAWCAVDRGFILLCVVRMNPRSTAHQSDMQTAAPQRRYTTRMIYYTIVEASTLTVTTQRRMNPRSTAHQAGMQTAWCAVDRGFILLCVIAVSVLDSTIV